MARKRLTGPNPAFLGAGDTAKSAAAPIAAVVGQSAEQAALAEVSAELEKARAEERLIVKLPLELIDLNWLARDRMRLDAEGFEALKASIRAQGQRVAVELAAQEDGRYGLISGMRRVMALKALYEETGADRFAQVLGIVRAPEDLHASYVAMVEENEIREGISFYERAHLVVAAVRAGVFKDEAAALKILYANVPRAKRSKIKSFTALVEMLDGHVEYPQQISEKLGLALIARYRDDAEGLNHLTKRVLKPGLTAQNELDLLQIAADLPRDGEEKRPREFASSPKEPNTADMTYRFKGGMTLIQRSGRIEIRGSAHPARLFDRLVDFLEQK